MNRALDEWMSLEDKALMDRLFQVEQDAMHWAVLFVRKHPSEPLYTMQNTLFRIILRRELEDYELIRVRNLAIFYALQHKWGYLRRHRVQEGIRVVLDDLQNGRSGASMLVYYMRS
jgi:hypothetical protein